MQYRWEKPFHFWKFKLIIPMTIELICFSQIIILFIINLS